jgi:membrane fusion protein, multidrug efflux system
MYSVAGKSAAAVLSIVMAAVAVLLSGCNSNAQDGAAPPAPHVRVAKVISRQVTQWDEFTGRIAAVETVELTPRVGGYIEKVTYREGQEVRQGDVLFIIDARSYRAELERVQAELARTRSRIALAHSELARARTLAKTHAISKEELDQREAVTTQAGSDVHAAEAAVAIARLNLSFTQVTAPISGRAGRAMITTGNIARPESTVLTTLVSLDPVFVYFEGDEQTYLRYNRMARDGGRKSSRDVSNPVRVGLADETGYPHEGTVDFVDNQVDPTTGTIRARAILANADRVFTPGLFARVQLIGSSAFPALLIDEKAVMTDQDRKYVYTLGANNSAVRKDVVLGRMVDGLRIVESGLKADDQVIVSGMQKVFVPGMTVQPQSILMGSAAQGVR